MFPLKNWQPERSRWGVFNESLPADKMLLQNMQAKESLLFSIPGCNLSLANRVTSNSSLDL